MTKLAYDQFPLTVWETVLDNYFATLNQGQFQEAALLFSAHGVVHPPVEEPIVGRTAIAAYFQSEMPGIRLEPIYRQFHFLEDGQKAKVQVYGRVRLCPFSTYVVWTFLLNKQGEIESVKVDLMAS